MFFLKDDRLSLTLVQKSGKANGWQIATLYLLIYQVTWALQRSAFADTSRSHMQHITPSSAQNSYNMLPWKLEPTTSQHGVITQNTTFHITDAETLSIITAFVSQTLP
jgi:hypothetical protein